MHKFNAKLFVILALLAAIVAFIVIINQSRAYKTELDILVLPRNEKTAQSLDQTVESIKQIPLSLSFYNKMLEANKDIEDGANGLPDYKRKAHWNSKISTERIGRSGIIKLEVFDENQWQSEILAYQLKNDIFTVISKYYNIKLDLEPRLIDGPITQNTISSGFWTTLAKSIGIGFVVSLVITFLAGFISAKKENFFNSQYNFQKDIAPNLKIDDKRDFEYAFPAKKSAAEEVLEEIQAGEINATEEEVLEENAGLQVEAEAISVSADKPIRNAGSKASAPGNLPFTEEGLPDIFNGNKNSVKKEAIVAGEKPASSYKEATPEEVKARLMKLLNGKG